MKSLHPFKALLWITLASAAAPAFARDVPSNLEPPKDQALLFDLHAEGFQVYECAAGKTGPEWVFRAPEATLSDVGGVAAGKHYGGPTWEAPDGSSVVGEVVANAAGTDAQAIPQLLLKAKSHQGNGSFARVLSVQRLDTHGGRAPATGCGQETLGAHAKQPYSARYFFYGAKPY
jgi:hypothetical protein